MATPTRKLIEQALDAASREVEGLAASGGKYARGLAGEGYTGGYRDALRDVLLVLDGVVPNRNNWWRPDRG